MILCKRQPSIRICLHKNSKTVFKRSLTKITNNKSVKEKKNREKKKCKWDKRKLLTYIK